METNIDACTTFFPPFFCRHISHHRDGQFFHPERKQLLRLPLGNSELFTVDI